MSRTKKRTFENIEFIERFIEACGTSRPAEIQRLLNIPYQTVKNYLNGRLPQADMLVRIGEQTSCSIDWLLTGRGQKNAALTVPEATPLLTRQIQEFVRNVCVEVINEMNLRTDTAQAKIVVLQSSEVMSEKVTNESVKISG